MRLILVVMVLLFAWTAHARPKVAVTYEAGGFNTLLKILEPEDAQCTLGFRGQIRRDTVPFTVLHAVPHAFYALECILADGSKIAQKIEARPGKIGVVRLKKRAAKPDPKPAPTLQPMTDPKFRVLTAAVAKAAFSADKLAVLKTAMKARLTVAQLGILVDLLSFSNDKITAVQLLRGRIIDPDNAPQIAQHFSFSNDKQAALRLLTQP